MKTIYNNFSYLVKFILFLLLSSSFTGAFSQTVTLKIPDEDFRTYLLETYKGGGYFNPTSTPEEISATQEQINAVDTIIIPMGSFLTKTGFVRSYSGIEYFINLVKFEDKLSFAKEVDFSQNIHLQDLSLQNFGYGFVNSKEDITPEIDLSANIKLKKLNLTGAYFTTVDLTHHKELTDFICHAGYITDLNLQENRDLVNIDLTRSRVKSIDITNLKSLEVLNLNETGIQTIDVSTNDNLRELYISTDVFLNGLIKALEEGGAEGNLLRPKLGLSNLNLGDINKLETLELKGNQLEKLDLSNQSSLKELNLWGATNLSELTLDKDGDLEKIRIVNTALEEVDLSDHTVLNDVHISHTKTIETIDLRGTDIDKLSISYLNSIDEIIVDNLDDAKENTHWDINLPDGVNTFSERNIVSGLSNGTKIELSVYPNPSSDIINITSEVPVSVTLSEMNGKVLSQESSEDNHSVLNVASLNRGVYLLKVTDLSSGNSYTKKIIVD